ncbi:3-oxoacyl-[acyl-carrier protein] reductase [Bradyrhizobium shewense]|uniref:3-oxoacyl-[acyl-carrier protein] reductase n=1 Tax=Bradyrhizobium shewense TaxID=1761772 RepID=A0A1C3XUI1_9BRAD|nr:SDR family oxidoreductase [Bradyrhizobium shewense]SCB55933.1 3-oxoacyl-[acyl-carrier protein] reductase [Bradyrhizobium shewense]
MANANGKVAIVTGGSRGIGAAIAERLGIDGFTVVINYAGGAAEAETLAEKISQAGGRAITVQADVSNASAVASMFNTVESAFGGVDVLVNNAGVMQLAAITEAEDSVFDSQIAINLKGTFNTLREATRRLRNDGRIVNLSSSQTGLLHPTYGIYAATKAAIEAMTQVLSKELRGRNITVNAVAPGPTATKLFLHGKSKDVIDHLAKLAPLERLGEPVDVAAAVAFLTGPDGGWINGQVLRANGGII